MWLIADLRGNFSVIGAFRFRHLRVDNGNLIEYRVRQNRGVDGFGLQNGLLTRVFPQLVNLNYPPENGLSLDRPLLQVKVVDLERSSDGPEIERATCDVLKCLVDLRLNDYRYLVLPGYFVVSRVAPAPILQLVAHVLEYVHVFGVEQNPVALQKLHQTRSVLNFRNQLVREYRHSVLCVRPHHLRQHVSAQATRVRLVEPPLSQERLHGQNQTLLNRAAT